MDGTSLFGLDIVLIWATVLSFRNGTTLAWPVNSIRNDTLVNESNHHHVTC